MTVKAELKGILESLTDLVGDQLKTVSYKWLSREFHIPYDTSKRILFEFMSKQSQKVQASFFISGWTKEDNPRHVMKIVDLSALEDAKSQLQVITAIHVYSVQPATISKGLDAIYNTDYDQSESLFRKLLSSSDTTNPLATDALSSIHYAGIGREHAAALAAPHHGGVTAPEPTKPTKSASINITTKSTVEKKVEAPKPIVVQKTKTTTAPKTTAPKTTAQKKQKKAAVQREEENQKVQDDAAVVINDDDDVAEKDKRGSVALVSGKAGKAKRTIDDSESEGEEMKERVIKKAGSPAKKKQKSQKNADGNKSKVITQQPPSTVQTIKKKVMKTYYNDAGEEVTEMVEVSDDESAKGEDPRVEEEEEGKKKEALPAASPATKKSPKVEKKKAAGGSGAQRSIASFFSKKQ